MRRNKNIIISCRRDAKTAPPTTDDLKAHPVSWGYTDDRSYWPPADIDKLLLCALDETRCQRDAVVVRGGSFRGKNPRGIVVAVRNVDDALDAPPRRPTDGAGGLAALWFTGKTLGPGPVVAAPYRAPLQSCSTRILCVHRNSVLSY